ncbi:hypothetical protein Ahy_B06g085449 [Arachis hypogaea]|uniref:Calmodulin-binding domain-containing protein n=1 Tax=Arachis hypogaea TaxID=3818 RepID=A0A444YUM0_ARAHY|nr:hypothetical protein Ahy_B06g085449 [Arachis hypogaea]
MSTRHPILSRFICFVALPKNHSSKILPKNLLAEEESEYMATKAKPVTAAGKEKKTSSLISSFRRTTKSSTATATATTNKTTTTTTTTTANKTTTTTTTTTATPATLERNKSLGSSNSSSNSSSLVYPKATFRSSLDYASTFKDGSSPLGPNKSDRRRSFEPRLTPTSSPSSSPAKPVSSTTTRLQKALVSPGRPRDTTTSKGTSIPSPRPASDRTSSRIPRDVKQKPVLTNSNGGSSVKPKPGKVVSAEASSEVSDVEAEEVKELVEVVKEENHDDVEVDELLLLPDHPDVLENEEEQILEGGVHDLNDFGDDERVISTVSEELKEESSPPKEEENTNKNDNDQEDPHVFAAEEEDSSSSTKEAVVVVVEEPEKELGVIEEDQESETNEEERKLEEKNMKLLIQGGASESEEEAVEVTKEEEPKPQKEQQQQQQQKKREIIVSGHGRKESQLSNEVIEETATKLMEEMNKVRALAGAFQTVIDNQTARKK